MRYVVRDPCVARGRGRVSIVRLCAGAVVRSRVVYRSETRLMRGLTRHPQNLGAKRPAPESLEVVLVGVWVDDPHQVQELDSAQVLRLPFHLKKELRRRHIARCGAWRPLQNLGGSGGRAAAAGAGGRGTPARDLRDYGGQRVAGCPAAA